MSIHRTRHATNWTPLPNRPAQDMTMSLAARGLLWELLTRPADWRVVADEIARREPDGRARVRSALRELQEHGYAVLVRGRDERGRSWSRWEIFDVPQLPAATRAASGVTRADAPFPQVAPDAGRPAAGEPAAIKKTETKDKAKENTGATRRAVAPHPPIADKYAAKVVREICAELQATPAEARTIAAIIGRGNHPNVARYTISCARWGQRASRRVAEVICIRHRLPVAVDGSCGEGCEGVTA